MLGGKEENLGPCAHVEQGGLHVVLVSMPWQPLDLALCRSLDLDCTEMKYICVKSTGHCERGTELVTVPVPWL